MWVSILVLDVVVFGKGVFSSLVCVVWVRKWFSSVIIRLNGLLLVVVCFVVVLVRFVVVCWLRWG